MRFSCCVFFKFLLPESHVIESNRFLMTYERNVLTFRFDPHEGRTELYFPLQKEEEKTEAAYI